MSLVMLSLLTITVDFRGGRSGPFEAAGEAALSVIGPLQSGVSRVFRPVASFFSGLIHAGSLREENLALRREIEELQAEISENVGVARERTQLLELLDLQRELGLEGKAAVVVGQSPSNFEWTVTIDVGSGQGIEQGMPVVTGKGLVGHVVRVSRNNSIVQLIVDPDSSVAARLASSGETGLLVGRGNRDLVMDLVLDAEATIGADEQVVTSGYDNGLYPPGIIIGVVSHAYQDPAKLQRTIEVRPAVDFSALEFVIVVTGR